MTGIDLASFNVIARKHCRILTRLQKQSDCSPQWQNRLFLFRNCRPGLYRGRRFSLSFTQPPLFRVILCLGKLFQKVVSVGTTEKNMRAVYQSLTLNIEGKQGHYSWSHSNLYLPTAQRSAHELPMVEKQNMDSCSVLGGQQMILTGQNFSADSKVIFTEKTHGEYHPAN